MKQKKQSKLEEKYIREMQYRNLNAYRQGGAVSGPIPALSEDTEGALLRGAKAAESYQTELNKNYGRDIASLCDLVGFQRFSLDDLRGRVKALKCIVKDHTKNIAKSLDGVVELEKRNRKLAKKTQELMKKVENQQDELEQLKRIVSYIGICMNVGTYSDNLNKMQKNWEKVVRPKRLLGSRDNSLGVFDAEFREVK